MNRYTPTREEAIAELERRGVDWRKKLGIIQEGNIDLENRPVIYNDDGSISTLQSISVGFDGNEVLIPTIDEQGNRLSEEEAINLYKNTGKHLGIFDNPDAATKYAQGLSKRQAARHEFQEQNIKPIEEYAKELENQGINVQQLIRNELDRRGVDWKSYLSEKENKLMEDQEQPTWAGRQLRGALSAFLGAGQAAGNIGAAINPANIVSRFQTGEDILPGGAINPLNLLSRQLSGENILPAVDVLSAAPEGYEFAKGIGEFTGEMLAPIPSSRLRAVGELAKGGGLLSKTSGLGGRITDVAVEGAAKSAFGALENVLGDESLSSDEKESAMQNALMYGTAFNAALYPVTKLPTAIKSKNLEEIKNIIEDLPAEAIEHIPQSLLTDSHFVKQAEEMLAHMPGDKQRNLYNAFIDSEKLATNRIADQFYFDSATNQMIGKNEIDNVVTDKLRNLYFKIRGKSNNLYNNVENMAEKAGVSIKSSESKSTKLIDELIDKLETTGTIAPNRYKEIYPLLKDMQKNRMDEIVKSPILSASGKPIQSIKDRPPLNYTDIHSDHIQIGQLAEQLGDRGFKFEAGFMKKLESALKDDMKMAVNQSKNKNIIKEFDKAEQYFKNNVAPYTSARLESGLRKNDEITNIGSKILRAPSNQVKKILGQMDNDLRRLTVGSALKNQTTTNSLERGYELDPTKMTGAFSKTGQSVGKYKKQLLTSDLLKEIDKLNKLNRKLMPIKSALASTPTGKQVYEKALYSSGGALGYALGNIPGAIAGYTLAPVATNLATDVLQSNALRQILRGNERISPLIQSGVEANIIPRLIAAREVNLAGEQ